MHVYKHQLYLIEQHRESFEIWPSIKRMNTESRSLIMKLGPTILPLFSLSYLGEISVLGQFNETTSRHHTTLYLCKYQCC